MPIEFRCQQCNKLLRVGDETAGKQAKCPACATVQLIPASTQSEALPQSEPAAPAGGNPFGAEPQLPPPDQGDQLNPYRSPPSAIPGVAADRSAAAPLVSQPIDVGDILNRTWIIFKVHWGMCTLAFFVTWIIQVAFGLIVGQLSLLSLHAAGVGQNQDVVEGAAQILTQIASFLFTTWIKAGLSLFMLNVAKGGTPNISDVFAGGRYFLAMLPARFLFYLMWMLGMAACFVPGIILVLMFCQYYLIIIDRDAGAIESLRLSSRITYGNKANLFLLGLAMFGIGVLGVLALCVGMFFATALNFLMLAVAYLAMTGQRTADELLDQPIYQ